MPAYPECAACGDRHMAGRACRREDLDAKQRPKFVGRAVKAVFAETLAKAGGASARSAAHDEAAARLLRATMAAAAPGNSVTHAGLNDTQKKGRGRPKGSGQGLTRAQRTAKWRKDNPQAHRDQQARAYDRKAKA